MEFLNKLQKLNEGVKPTKVMTKKLGEVELLPMFVSHRNMFHKVDLKEGDRDFSLMMIALSLADKGKRIVDHIDLDEVIQMLDPLGKDKEGLEDIVLLFTEANKLSKVTVSEVEEAEKN